MRKTRLKPPIAGPGLPAPVSPYVRQRAQCGNRSLHRTLFAASALSAKISRLCLLLPDIAMSLLDAPTYRTSSKPLRSAKLPEEAYVLSIASLPSSYATAASSPSNVIHLFDKERLRNVQTLPGHASSITTLRSVPNVANAVTHALLSSGKDGNVHVWDERAGSAALRCEPPTHPSDRDVPTTQWRI